jgi:exo-beta-1,3-glucanase (GH17 family)
LKRSTQLILAACVLANLAVWAWVYRAHEAPDWTGTVISGVSFSPYEAGQDPKFGDEPEEATIKRDLIQLKDHVRRVRTYNVLGTLGTIPEYAGTLGLTVTAGAWIDSDQAKSQTEVDTLIKLAIRHISIERVLVGNEALLRKDVTTNSLITEIEKVRRQTTKPVGTAEPWHIWLDNPELADAVAWTVALIFWPETT